MELEITPEAFNELTKVIQDQTGRPIVWQETNNSAHILVAECPGWTGLVPVSKTSYGPDFVVRFYARESVDAKTTGIVGELSTGHIKAETAEALQEHFKGERHIPVLDGAYYTCWSDYGWIFRPLAIEDETMEGLRAEFPDLFDVLTYARDLGWLHLQLDSDALALVEKLPYYEW